MYPGDLLCILVTPQSACQEGAYLRGGIHQGLICPASWARLAGELPWSLLVDMPFRTQLGHHPAAADGLSLGGRLPGRPMKVDALPRCSAARTPRSTLKYGAHRRKSAEADWTHACFVSITRRLHPANSSQPDGIRLGWRPATTERGACGRARAMAPFPAADTPERGARDD